MHSETVIESRGADRGRRRKRGNASAEGPVFVDTSGRRSKLLRRIGILLGVVCLAYAGVLGAAFMGWGTSLTPSSLLPFGDTAQNVQGPGGLRPDGGIGNRIGRPGGTPSAQPSGAADPTSSASAAAAAN
ncbi:hypothetical protein [Streptomyces adustus]|uniref:hypothetical protein n=1 Tax=Streptomyces adustus TaxID=1609272 RepID=UPI00192E4CC3|nr:hypothetical protein [Streptomyces adustus]